LFVATNNSIEQIVDSLCDALLQDEGTLNNRERELLAGVLQYVKGDSEHTEEIDALATAKVQGAIRSVVTKRVLNSIAGLVVERLTGSVLEETLGTIVFQEQVLEAMARLLGKEHPNTLTSMLNLAQMLQAEGDLAGAERLYRLARRDGFGSAWQTVIEGRPDERSPTVEADNRTRNRRTDPSRQATGRRLADRPRA